MKNFFNDLLNNAGSKGLPAAAGGIGAKLLTNKFVKPMLADYRKKNPLEDPSKPGFLEYVSDLTPGFIGLALLNKKNDAWSYAGAGMIAVASADTVEDNVQAIQGDDSNRLADNLDEIFRKYMKK